MLKGVGRIGLTAAALVVVAMASAGPKAAAAEGGIYTAPNVILKTFPKAVKPIAGGVRLRLTNGRWEDVLERPLVKDTSVLCLYAPRLHAAAVCETDGETTVTVLLDLNTGHKIIAPGRPTVRPGGKLIAVGPSDKYVADSLTLVAVTPTKLTDVGGALFGDDFSPGGWADDDCYRLQRRNGGPDGWLERTAAGWAQAQPGQSQFCAKRHGG